MFHYLTIFRDIYCFAEISTSKLIDIRTCIEQYIGICTSVGLIDICTIYYWAIFKNIYSLTWIPGQIGVRSICLSIQESCLKVFPLFGNILGIIWCILLHVGSKHIVRRYFEISAYLVLILLRYKCNYHHCSMYAAYFVLSFCKTIC